MATATQTPNTAADNSYVDSQDVIVGLVVTTEDGKTIKTPAVYPASEKKAAELEKLETEGKFEGLAKFTTRVTYPKTFDGLLAAVDTPEKQSEAISNHNRGAAGKVANRLKAIVAKAIETDDNGKSEFDSTVLKDGILDLTDQVFDPPKRLSLTEEEKFDRFLETMSVSEDKKQQMKAIWKASQ